MLKNAIESADYYPDSRKRRHVLRSSYEKGFTLCAGASEPRLWTFFITPDSILGGFYG